MECGSQHFFSGAFTCTGDRARHSLARIWPDPAFQQVALLTMLVLLLLGSTWITWQHSQAYASVDQGTCTWYHIRTGDTLTAIAAHYHTNVSALAHANAIHNNNVIHAGRTICIPHPGSHTQSRNSGLRPNGVVKWYAYNALQSSTHSEVVGQLRQAAAHYHLPASLLLAIAWQESGWTQHIISRDGGIGVMQVMPYTAMNLNTMVRAHHDPYKLGDNIELGSIYLHTLWINFHGNLPKVISAYNEGGWTVVHRGICNQSYVNAVQALMRRFH